MEGFGRQAVLLALLDAMHAADIARIHAWSAGRPNNFSVQHARFDKYKGRLVLSTS